MISRKLRSPGFIVSHGVLLINELFLSRYKMYTHNIFLPQQEKGVLCKFYIIQCANGFIDF